jgi:diphthamide biosynthesis protein 2
VVRTYRLPVIYVFGQKPIDVDHCVKQLVSILDASSADNEPKDKKAILLRHDVVYTHRAGENYPYLCHYICSLDSSYLLIDNIVDKLRIAFEPLKISVLYSRVALRKDPPSTALDLRQDADRSATSTNESLIEDCTILYIGGESLGLTNLLMTHASCEVRPYVYPCRSPPTNPGNV